MSRPINPNDRVRVRLTEHGKRLIVKSVDEFNEHMRTTTSATFRQSVPQWDSDGYLNGQFHVIMGLLGDCWSGVGELPFTEMKSLGGV
jgi:hypothetical protein